MIKSTFASYKNEIKYDNFEYISLCEQCKSNGIGYDDDNTQLCYCKKCWKKLNDGINYKKIKQLKNQKDKLIESESRQSRARNSYSKEPKITNYV